MMESRVVFPQPLGPRKEMNSPSSTSSEILVRAVVEEDLVKYVWRIPFKDKKSIFYLSSFNS
jgi:hypothetical protein